MSDYNPNEVPVTTYDKVMFAWHECMYLTKVFETHFHETKEDDKARDLFEKAANELGYRAADFREWLLDNWDKDHYQIERK